MTLFSATLRIVTRSIVLARFALRFLQKYYVSCNLHVNLGGMAGLSKIVFSSSVGLF